MKPTNETLELCASWLNTVSLAYRKYQRQRGWRCRSQYEHGAADTQHRINQILPPTKTSIALLEAIAPGEISFALDHDRIRVIVPRDDTR